MASAIIPARSIMGVATPIYTMTVAKLWKRYRYSYINLQWIVLSPVIASKALQLPSH